MTRYQRPGGFSDALQRGALPAFDNGAIMSEHEYRAARGFHAAAGAFKNSDQPSGPPLQLIPARGVRRVSVSEAKAVGTRATA